MLSITLIVFLIGILNSCAFSHHFSSSAKTMTIHKNPFVMSKWNLYANQNDNDKQSNKRRVIRYDNLGDPIYEGEGDEDSNGLNILGIKLNVDAPTLAAIGFGLIAFNFFVLANINEF